VSAGLLGRFDHAFGRVRRGLRRNQKKMEITEEHKKIRINIR